MSNCRETAALEHVSSYEQMYNLGLGRVGIDWEREEFAIETGIM